MKDLIKTLHEEKKLSHEVNLPVLKHQKLENKSEAKLAF